MERIPLPGKPTGEIDRELFAETISKLLAYNLPDEPLAPATINEAQTPEQRQARNGLLAAIVRGWRPDLDEAGIERAVRKIVTDAEAVY